MGANDKMPPSSARNGLSRSTLSRIIILIGLIASIIAIYQYIEYHGPIVNALQGPIIPFGENITIRYTVSDSGKYGLSHVELWRMDETGVWTYIPPSVNVSGSGPISGYFKDKPHAPGIYLYGVHVFDNSGRWYDEQRSNIESIKVEIRNISR